MVESIMGWDSLKERNQLKKGTPGEYVLYSVYGDILSIFGAEQLSAVATIGQRDESGRLFQNSLHSRHFEPRKFTIVAKSAEAQIELLHRLVNGLNSGSIDVGLIPEKVASTKRWAQIERMVNQ